MASKVFITIVGVEEQTHELLIRRCGDIPSKSLVTSKVVLEELLEGVAVCPTP